MCAVSWAVQLSSFQSVCLWMGHGRAACMLDTAGGGECVSRKSRGSLLVSDSRSKSLIVDIQLVAKVQRHFLTFPPYPQLAVVRILLLFESTSISLFHVIRGDPSERHHACFTFQRQSNLSGFRPSSCACISDCTYRVKYFRLWNLSLKCTKQPNSNSMYNLIMWPTCHKALPPTISDVIMVSDETRYAATLNCECPFNKFHYSTHCGLEWPNGDRDLVNIRWGNVYLLADIKPVPEPMLTSDWWGSVTFNREKFHSHCPVWYSV